jgi:hypothetical protein
VHHGYPKQILKVQFDLTDLHKLVNVDSVWDVENGIILQLGENKEVVNAMKGFKKLSNSEIKDIYGSPPRFTNLKWP